MKNNATRRLLKDRIKRFTILLIALFFQLLLIGGYAQTIKFTVQEKNKTVQEFLNLIEKKSQMVFYYVDIDIDLTRKLNIDIKDQYITNVLDELFKNSLNYYKIDGTRIYIYKKIKEVEETTKPINSRSKVTGVVVDENNQTVIGANIIVNGTNNAAITDINGRFSIEASENSQLRISYIGYETKAVNIDKKTSLKISLEQSLKTLDEVVVVGYGMQKKETVVGSVTQVNSDVIKERGVVSNITDALSGSMPGVIVMTPTGIPGGQSNNAWGASSFILIRGTNTWNNTSPLVLVDGIERNMNDIDINEISSFSVLKDASATAVFGVKGANGVILITTKRGQIGKPKVPFETNYSLKSVSLMNSPVDSYQALMARNYAIVGELAVGGATQWGKYIPERELNYYRDKIDPEKYTDVNWFDFMTRDYSISSKYNVTVSGGSDFVKYFTSVGYIQDGDILNTGTPNSKGVAPEFRYDRFNFRSNFDFNITKTTQLSVNLSGYIGKQQMSAGNYPKIMSGIANASPNSPLPIYSDGVYGATDPVTTAENAYKVMMTSGTDTYNRNSFKSDFELKQQLDFITKGLSFKSKFSFDNYYLSRGREINDDGSYISKRWDNTTNDWIYTYPSVTTGFEFVPTPLGYTNEYIDASAAEQTLRNVYYEFGLTYSRKFNSHRIGALALMSREDFVTGSNWPNKREDWVGRITYDYESKYLLEVNGAYNGSAKFGPNFRFDFFPSFAAGWRISEEKFIKKILPQLTNLKLKYSIGLIGSDNFNGVGMWPFITSYVSNPDKLSRFGNSAFTETPYNLAFREGTPGNPDVRWEKARKQDIGLEFDLFNGLFSGSADYFNEFRSDMLIAGNQRNVPDFYGAAPSAVNSGEVQSKGLELELKIQKKIGKVNLWAAGNWTQAVNKIIYKEDPALMPAYQKKAEYSIGQNTSYVIDGIVQSWDQMYTGVLYETGYTNNTTIIPGDYRMIDYNADGVINSQDIVPYQYANYPQNTYGFSFGGNYSGFALSIQFYGSYNVSINASERLEFENTMPVVFPDIISRTWTPEYGNSNPNWRAFNTTRNSTKGSLLGNSTMYDGSFLRLKTAELSYTFPKKWMNKLSVDRCRVYLNGNNLFFWSNMPFDLEGTNFVTYSNYPTTKLYNLGLQVTF